MKFITDFIIFFILVFCVYYTHSLQSEGRQNRSSTKRKKTVKYIIVEASKALKYITSYK